MITAAASVRLPGSDDNSSCLNVVPVCTDWESARASAITVTDSTSGPTPSVTSSGTCSVAATPTLCVTAFHRNIPRPDRQSAARQSMRFGVNVLNGVIGDEQSETDRQGGVTRFGRWHHWYQRPSQQNEGE